MADDQVEEIEIVVEIAADLVYDAGGPTTITNTATVAGVTIDPDPADNTVTEDTTSSPSPTSRSSASRPSTRRPRSSSACRPRSRCAR